MDELEKSKMKLYTMLESIRSKKK